jgi:hypothetical protein
VASSCCSNGSKFRLRVPLRSSGYESSVKGKWVEKCTYNLWNNCDIWSQGIEVELTGQDSVIEYIPFC